MLSLHKSGSFMKQRSFFTSTGRFSKLLVLLSVISLFAVLMFQTSSISRHQATLALQNKTEADLNRYVITVQQKLDRFKDLPKLLSTHPDLLSILPHPESEANKLKLNRFLEQVNDIIGASDTYLMNREGITVASSNWSMERSFIGGNFSFRPYFTDAVLGKAGSYFALGSTSQQRGYFFSYPVYSDNQVVGVIVVKIDLNDVEDQWNDPLQDILVTDNDDVIFISTRSDWKFRTLTPLSPEDQQRIKSSRRYGDNPLIPLDIMDREWLMDGVERVTMKSVDHQSSGQPDPLNPKKYLLMTQSLDNAGLNVSMLSSTREVEQKVLAAMLQVTFIYLALLLLIWVLRVRYRLTLQQQEFQQREHKALECRVQERTKDLVDINARLMEEMTQHRNTQNELIQTAKLAVLGQLSAGINHELNQPLTAIRNYADNGLAFLERGRQEPVHNNLKEISALTDRMAKIIHPLKEFSRKSTQCIEPVSIKQIRDGVMSVMYGRFEKEQVNVQWPDQVGSCWVMADRLRLEQVFVNLLTNALQAVADQTDKMIRVDVIKEPAYMQISVVDNGPGIRDPERIFEPFYTTKSSGQGIGLGLPISQRIIESFYGSLSAHHHPEGGAEFRLLLPSASSQAAPDITATDVIL